MEKINIEIIRSKEKEVLRILEKKGKLKQYPGTSVRYISENLFVTIVKGDNFCYIDKNANEVLFIKKIRMLYEIPKAMALAGYREIEVNGKKELYQVEYIDSRTGNPLNGTHPVDRYSLDYFNAWKNTNFFSDRIFMLSSKLKLSVEKVFPKIGYDELMISIRDHTIRINDVEEFLKNGQISLEVFNKVLPHLQDILVDQCGDFRFKQSYDSLINKKELDGYKKAKKIGKHKLPPRISENLYRKCLETILLRDKFLFSKFQEGKITMAQIDKSLGSQIG
ncbi:MAG: hypothetical protein PHS92_02035 [Candidatus Gracilibacteria bacterium]|nr:hypothetical protein [Candidatus Gracilibacteria bacterium]